MSLSALDLQARDQGIIKSVEEDYRMYVGRIWSKLTGRDDYDVVYSTLALMDVLKNEAPTPGRSMRDRIQKQVQVHLDEIKTEDAKVDADFMKLLKDV
jgi:predicted chitinase